MFPLENIRPYREKNHTHHADHPDMRHHLGKCRALIHVRARGGDHMRQRGKLLYPCMSALQHLYGGGFSGTIGAEQTEANSFWYRKINAVNGDDTGVVLDQIGGTDDGCHEIFLPSM